MSELAIRQDGRVHRTTAAGSQGHWRYSVALAVLLTALIGARAHELMPLVPRLRPALLLAGIGGLLAILSTAPAIRQRALRDPLFALPAAYFGWAAITAPFALWIGAAVKGLQGALPALVLCFVILLCEPTLRTVERLQRGFVLGCVVTAILAQLRGFSVDGRLTTGASLDSNDLAAVMALVVPLCAGLITRARGLARPFWGLMLAVLVGTLVMTGSRGGVIAIAVSTAVFILGQPGRRRILYAIVALMTAVTAWNFGSASFRQRMSEFFVEGERDYNYTDWTGRYAVWARARGYFLSSPVIGVGIHNFPVAEGETCKREFPGQGCKWSDTHNAYLQSAAELGIPGVALFVAMLVAGGRRAYAMWKPSRAGRRGSVGDWHRPEFLGAIAGFAAAAYFLSHAYFYLMFALLALVAVAARAATRARAAERAPDRPGLARAEPTSARPAFVPGYRGGLARIRTGVD